MDQHQHLIISQTIFSNCTSTFRILNSCICLAVCQTKRDLTLYRQTLTRAVESSWRPFEETHEAMFKQVSVASRNIWCSSYEVKQLHKPSKNITCSVSQGQRGNWFPGVSFIHEGNFYDHLNNRLCCQILQLNQLLQSIKIL